MLAIAVVTTRALADDPPSAAPYKVQVVLADVAAIAVIPGGVAGFYLASNQKLDGALVFATVPVCVVGPLVHLMNGRPIAALVSFLGWTASAALTWTIFFGARGRACASSGCEDLYGMSVGFGLPSALVGSAAMTLTDAALAHDMRQEKS